MIETITQYIFPEMMTHPALFTHSNPKKVIILGDQEKLIQNEVLKHISLNNIGHEIETCPPATVDIIINANNLENTHLLECFFELLQHDGILVQQTGSYFDVNTLKSYILSMKKIGFSDFQLLNFPHPDYNMGWRSTLMSMKSGIFNRLREKVIFNKPFKTNYYNFDMHKAATVLPEFIRNNITF